MKMRTPVICALLLLSARSFSQNLLANGDFEEENICTEYIVNCAPEAWIANKDGFSTYFKDTGSAHSGTHFLAIEVGHSSKTFQRTFSRTRLLCGLRKDHIYKLEFYVKSQYDILDSVGVIFTSFDFLFGKKRLQQLLPSMFLQPASGSFTTDSNWQKVSMNYLAKGDEAFLSIANFSKRDITGVPNDPKGGHLFIFVDDISLVPLDSREQLCREALANKEDIYAQDERHEFLRQGIRQNNDNPPTVVIPFTSILNIDTLVLPDMLFATGKAELHKSSYGLLDDFCRKISGKNIDSIVVEGHTDNRGTFAANKKLSGDRANVVKEALRQRLSRLKPLIVTRGWADMKPVESNKTTAGRQQNRRVELFVYTRE
ncbi:MAG TPA: OmpA family protein [Chitinophagaceae bacterium]